MSVHLDAVWFDRFVAASQNTTDTEWLKKFIKISATEQTRFYEDEIENPAFHLKGVAKVVGAIELQKLKTQIEAEEKNETVRDLYLKKIDNQLLRFEMLSATVAGDDEQFSKLSQELYGKPKKKYFAYIAKRIHDRLNEPLSPDQEEAAKSLQAIFSKIDTTNAVTDNDALPDLVEDTEPALCAAEVGVVFSETLATYGIDDWEVIVDSSGERPRFSVNPNKKIVYVPHDTVLQKRKSPLTRTAALALAEHEVGVHVRRFHQGSRQSLLLLRMGLDNYLRGEEGIASYVQQQLEGATEYYGFDRYLAISLALGLDGEVRDFRALYTIMRDYYTLMMPSKQRGKDTVHNAAWDVCTRVFRGSTGQGAGTVFTRDLAYFEGNIGIWELLIREPDRYQDFFVGKYNPLLKRHVTALERLAILPK